MGKGKKRQGRMPTKTERLLREQERAEKRRLQGIQAEEKRLEMEKAEAEEAERAQAERERAEQERKKQEEEEIKQLKEKKEKEKLLKKQKRDKTYRWLAFGCFISIVPLFVGIGYDWYLGYNSTSWMLFHLCDTVLVVVAVGGNLWSLATEGSTKWKTTLFAVGSVLVGFALYSGFYRTNRVFSAKQLGISMAIAVIVLCVHAILGCNIVRNDGESDEKESQT